MNAAAVIASIVIAGCLYAYYTTMHSYIEILEEDNEALETELNRVNREYVAYIMSRQVSRCQPFLQQLKEDFSGMDDDMLREELQKAMENGKRASR